VSGVSSDLNSKSKNTEADCDGMNHFACLLNEKKQKRKGAGGI